jgi:endonuclease-3
MNLSKAERVAFIDRRLQELYPDPPIPLLHNSPFELLIAVLLSAQCTDERVNQVTPYLFQLANTPEAMSLQDQQQVYRIIKPCGLGPRKSKAIIGLSSIITNDYNGSVPPDLEQLEQLPGVGHKTASVVMAQAFGQPAFPVDTHIHRVSQRWGLTSGKNVVQTERDLKRLFPEERWSALHLQIIYYGREHCSARGCDGRICEICRTCYPDRKHPKLTKSA